MEHSSAPVSYTHLGDDTLVLFFYPVGVLNRFDGFVFKGCYCGFQVLFQLALFFVMKGLLCPVIRDMPDTIALYEAHKAKEKAEAQKKAEADAVTARKNQEIQTRKNTFLSALRDVENLEYQSSEAESLVQNAISKLSLVETYDEAASYKERLQKAIDRIATPVSYTHLDVYKRQGRTQRSY